jgi:hypothetical protein
MAWNPPRGRIRDLNDEINKLIREKGHWERRIVELGGPDYARSAPKVKIMWRRSRRFLSLVMPFWSSAAC